MIRNPRWGLLISGLLLSMTLAACGERAARANAPTPPIAPGGAPTVTAPSGGQTVRVVATNFAFAIEPSRVQAGSVTFILRNDSPAPHDFAIRGNGLDRKTPVIERGETATLTVELKPGTYTYLCAVPGHDRLGMQGTLAVP